jgi:hypothetical protein
VITFLSGVFIGVAVVLLVLSLSTLSDYLKFRGEKASARVLLSGRKSSRSRRIDV